MDTTRETRRALSAPVTDVTLITTDLIEQVIAASRNSERRRMILPLHKSSQDSLHRMFNAMQPNTFIQPHRHSNPAKAETVLVLRGSLCFVTFDFAGVVDQMIDLAAGSDVFGIDVVPGVFHTFLILQPDTVVFEVKPGPYSPTDDKDFATWAPREGDPAATAYLETLTRLRDERKGSGVESTSSRRPRN